jgi:L-histidine Nalpha-methyltransferase
MAFNRNGGALREGQETTREITAVPEPGTDTARFRADILRGLRQTRKRLPSKYFYDTEGSRLFDRICELDEYYPTRTELAIMRAHAAAMAAFLGPRIALVEYGSGSSVKTRLLLDTLDRPAAYLPVDISRDHLLAASAGIAKDYPELVVAPVVADFTKRVVLPTAIPQGARRVVYFPGSTIGNFTPPQAARLLRGMARVAGRGGAVLLGVDLKKDPVVLHRAYNDARGVTAAFNRNLLTRINRELGADFRPRRFDHYAFYSPRRGRIEMHLVSRSDQTIAVCGEVVSLAAGESIRTEYSYKYTVPEVRALATRAGLDVCQVWTDADRWFAVVGLIRS